MKLPFNLSFFHTEEPKPVPVTYSAELRNWIHSNTPIDFERKFDRVKPYLVASFLSWPMIWLYRGISWKGVRQADKITMYINRTFLQAKVLQFSILAAGLLAATYDDIPMVQNVRHVWDEMKNTEFDDTTLDP